MVKVLVYPALEGSKLGKSARDYTVSDDAGRGFASRGGKTTRTVLL
jgi:hypothetical protein